MAKFKIIHVVHDFLFGGIESYLYYLVQAQQANTSLEVGILCCQDERMVPNPRIKELGIKIYYVSIKAFDLRIEKYKKITEIVSRYHIAQLHIYKPLLLEALYRSKAKVIFTVHTAGAVRREHSFYARMKAKFQVKQLNRCCSGIVNNSFYSQKYWVQKGVRQINSVVIYNGVLFNHENGLEDVMEKFPDLRSNFIVGTTSRFIAWKRVDFVINAFANFRRRYSNSKLLLVGDGPEMNHLKSLVNDLGITDSVIFTGFQKQVTRFQSAMDVCVFASVSEPFGLVAIECMHLGKPVVVMDDGGGLVELVQQVEPDLIVSGVDSMADKFFELAINKDFLQSKLESSRIDFAEQFDIFEIERRYFEYYKSLEV